jgi:hypothetical protein
MDRGRRMIHVLMIAATRLRTGGYLAPCNENAQLQRIHDSLLLN